MVEDNAAVRAVAVAMLGELGYRITEAGSGREALDLLKRNRMGYDLLFTDMVMPGGLDGAALAKAAHRLSPGLRVLFTSGYAEAVTLREGGVGAGHLLVSKPFQRDVLAAKIREALEAAPMEAPAPALTYHV